MKDFHLERKMMSLLGDFYPTGHLFVMVPSEAEAKRAEDLLCSDGQDCTGVHLLRPNDILDVVHVFDGRDLALPSVGFEEHTVRHFAELARQGHHALLIPARNARTCEHLMEVLHGVPLSSAVYYRRFVIEELVA